MSDECNTCTDHEHELSPIFMEFEDLMDEYDYSPAEFVAEAAKFALAYEAAVDASLLCMDCYRHTVKMGEYYSLEDDIWEQANPDIDGMLCIECLESRLGRVLTKEDFIECPLNAEDGCTRSELLTRRLGYAA